MKCSRCDQEIDGVCYLIARFDGDGRGLNGNLCAACFTLNVGLAARTRIDNLLYRAGWVQPTLPNIS